MAATASEHLFDLASGGEPTIPVADLRAEFPQLEILHPLSHSGMGLVYLAVQTSLQRKVVLKLLPLAREEDPQYLARFRAEAIALAAVRHPGVVNIYDHGTTAAGRRWILMEFVEGETLAARIRKGLAGTTSEHAQQPFLIDEITALGIALDVCEALAAVHAAGIIHRDIKPANIIITTAGRARLIDFGIASGTIVKPAGTPPLTRTGVAIGTPGYMAPEQAGGGNVDHGADIFATGIILYEMLSGEIPTGLAFPLSVRLGAHKNIDSIIHRATAPRPGDRFDSAHTMAHALRDTREELIARPRAPIAPSATASRTGKKRTTFRFVAIAAAAALIAIAALRYFEAGPFSPQPAGANADAAPAGMHPVISPDGALYRDVNASSTITAKNGPAALFDQTPVVGRELDTSGNDDTEPLESPGPHPGRAYAGIGPGPHYVAFSLPEPYLVHSLFYAQRDFRNRHDARHDKARAIELWTSDTAPFAPADPHTPPARNIEITHRLDDTFREYAIGQPLHGTHFLIRIIPDLNPAGPLPNSAEDGLNTNPGGTELRLGGAPVSVFKK